MGKRICLGLLIGVLAFSLSALAQEVTGGIQGTVKDPQGAVIPGAMVEVSSPALIGKKTATTDSGGFFHIEQLPPGVYSISVNAPGFAPQTQGNLELRTGALPTASTSVPSRTRRQGSQIRSRYKPATVCCPAGRTPGTWPGPSGSRVGHDHQPQRQALGFRHCPR